MVALSPLPSYLTGMGMGMGKAEEIAKRWMHGTRQGSLRPAWAHPADVVVLLREMPGVRTPELDRFYEEVAWLHDIVEDGRKHDGSYVSSGDLTKEGISAEVIDAVIALSHREGEDKVSYLVRLRDASPRVKTVKAADRVCNLREGLRTFKNARWGRYVRETQQFILPLLEDVPSFESVWLGALLVEAMAARSIPPDSTP
jgi:(p)ppGpp synthase/HD superfamily hydrolase